MTHTYDDEQVTDMLNIVDDLVRCPKMDGRIKLATKIYDILDDKRE